MDRHAHPPPPQYKNNNPTFPPFDIQKFQMNHGRGLMTLLGLSFRPRSRLFLPVWWPNFPSPLAQKRWTTGAVG